MNILIIEDQYELKVKQALDYLESKIDFQYNLFDNVSESLIYLRAHLDEVDLIILDLALPWLAGQRIDSATEGLRVIEALDIRDAEVPIIINSTTKIKPNGGITEEEYFEHFSMPIVHVGLLDGEWLHKYILDQKL